jgi:uncharacterized protein YjbI with pentapeptide repeats
MAVQSHLDVLQQGVEAWNSWREQNPFKEPVLSNAYLSGANLSEADLHRAELWEVDLSGADLSRANLYQAYLLKANLSKADLHVASLHSAYLSEANFSEADLSKADLTLADLRKADLSRAVLYWAEFSGANLFKADLSRADLSWANLSGAVLSRGDLLGANLSGADLSEADLSDANLTRSTLVKTNLTGATLTGCSIYGISAWSLNLEGANQQSLKISDEGEPAITVDNLEVAQFVYLLLNNERIRQVIDTITSKVILILGRFTSDRKAILDAIREELRQRGYLPILFDFEKPAGRDLTETISTLAHMARFIIADITEAKSIPQELQAIVPNLPSVPVQPLLLTSEREYAMFEHFRKYPWVLDTYYYENLNDALASVEDKVISPAEAKVRELAR